MPHVGELSVGLGPLTPQRYLLLPILNCHTFGVVPAYFAFLPTLPVSMWLILYILIR